MNVQRAVGLLLRIELQRQRRRSHTARSPVERARAEQFAREIDLELHR